MRILILLFHFQLAFSLNELVQGDQSKYLQVESVDFKISTSIQISCDAFETQFKGRMRTKVLDDLELLNKLDECLSKVRYAKKIKGVDVRARFFYRPDNNSTVVICTDGNGILVNGRLIIRNKKFADFLVQLTKQ